MGPMGPPVDSGLTVAFFQWLNMVDITIFMGVSYFMVYKPTNI